jgi:hypothetical protein
VLADGEPVLYVGANRRSLTTFPRSTETGALGRAFSALGSLPGRARTLVVERVDGRPPGESPHRDLMEACGFVRDYRGYTLVPTRYPVD